MMFVLIVLVAVIAYQLGRILERTLLLRQLGAARRAADSADQIVISQIMRVMRGR
jgi:hypothetical protein